MASWTSKLRTVSIFKFKDTRIIDLLAQWLPTNWSDWISAVLWTWIRASSLHQLAVVINLRFLQIRTHFYKESACYFASMVQAIRCHLHRPGTSTFLFRLLWTWKGVTKLTCFWIREELLVATAMSFNFLAFCSRRTFPFDLLKAFIDHPFYRLIQSNCDYHFVIDSIFFLLMIFYCSV